MGDSSMHVFASANSLKKTILSHTLSCCVTCLLAMPGAALAFESDVHFGLTQWLARQAGYTADQAAAIALGNQRVDSGDVQFTDLLSLYACNARDPKAADAVRAHHFPSLNGVPNPPSRRVVEAGGATARKPLDDLLRAATGRETFLLLKLGEAVHVLQDSWSNQGEPGVPSLPSTWFACDAALAWAPPAPRGGPAPHQADVTALRPDDTTAMAAATFEALGRYPSRAGDTRSARPWVDVARELDGFVRADTKAAKADWFVAHGIADVTFLDGIDLPDGARPFTAIWTGRHIPPLPAFASGQHGVDPKVLRFFDDFFVRWISSDDFRSMARAFASPPRRGTTGVGAPATDVAIETDQLAARLRLWRVRDHGSVAALAHQRQAFSSRQLAALDKAAVKPDALVRASTPAAAVLAILPETAEVAPLLPYWVQVLPADGAPDRAVATVKFRHAPYDAVEVMATRTAEGWKIVGIEATVEH